MSLAKDKQRFFKVWRDEHGLIFYLTNEIFIHLYITFVTSATCDVTTCEGSSECWDDNGQQEAECKCKTGYIYLQNQCKGEILYKYEYKVLKLE